MRFCQRSVILGWLIWGIFGPCSALSVSETAASEAAVSETAVSEAAVSETAVSETAVSETQTLLHAGGPAGDVSGVPALSGADLQREVRAALKRWKKVPDPQAEAAASEFLALYRALEADHELPEKARNGLKRTLQIRLDALSRQILTHLEKERETSVKCPESAKRPRSVKRSGTENAAGRDGKDGVSEELGQIGGGAGGFGNGMGGMNGIGGNGQEQRVQESGEHLVEVIQATIHPDSWESNGGQGTIYFWMPNGSLIIRQTDANHEEIRNLLNQLRRAGS